MLKNAPETIIIEIAEILNNIAETGNYPNEITEGVITALQKPGKSKGPVENLRAITILSMLRKILAMCIRERVIERIDREIPPSQAAYRSGRSTTEHVFATKIMAVRSITSTNQNMHLLMLDMSKAFDTVNRSILLKDLSKIIENDELHLISITLNKKLRVRCGISISKIFHTGVPQGDSLSANQFTFYLAKALKIEHKTQIDHDYTSYNTQTRKITSLDHNYSKQQNNSINIDQEYADDISVITTNINIINYKKVSLPTILEKRNLTINETKTEEYAITRNGGDSWKKCRLLGSLLDTQNDIKRRKSLAIRSINKMTNIFYGKLSISIKLRTFDCYVRSIFLYNSELWTLTTTTENIIDSFHRRLLRTVCLNVRWPKIFKNETLYEITKTKPWSTIIKRKQLSWFGHLARLPDNTPAKLSLDYVTSKSFSTPRGRQLTTWIPMMKESFIEHNTTWENAFMLAKDRVEWSRFMRLHCDP